MLQLKEFASHERELLNSCLADVYVSAATFNQVLARSLIGILLGIKWASLVIHSFLSLPNRNKLQKIPV